MRLAALLCAFVLAGSQAQAAGGHGLGNWGPSPAPAGADLRPGDWLHLNDADYRFIGEAIDLKLFR